jgi:hypothetical protein
MHIPYSDRTPPRSFSRKSTELPPLNKSTLPLVSPLDKLSSKLLSYSVHGYCSEKGRVKRASAPCIYTALDKRDQRRRTATAPQSAAVKLEPAAPAEQQPLKSIVVGSCQSRLGALHTIPHNSDRTIGRSQNRRSPLRATIIQLNFPWVCAGHPSSDVKIITQDISQVSIFNHQRQTGYYVVIGQRGLFPVVPMVAHSPRRRRLSDQTLIEGQSTLSIITNMDCFDNAINMFVYRML